MKILMTVHHALERNAGAPGVTLRLADGFQGRGHEAEVASLHSPRVRLTGF